MMKTIQCDKMAFLGGPCALGGNKSVAKTVNNLPAHTKLRIESNLIICGVWDDCSVVMRVDGQIVWTKNFNTVGKTPIKVCDCQAHAIGV